MNDGNPKLPVVGSAPITQTGRTTKTRERQHPERLQQRREDGEDTLPEDQAAGRNNHVLAVGVWRSEQPS